MSASLAVVARSQLEESTRPDIAWIKKNVPVLVVGKALGLCIRHRRAKCWRPQNHRHGDDDPSLYFHERKNRVRCFVCDMRGGHSNVDLVMGVLGVKVGDAVRWIAERFPVPNVKRGRPVGRRLGEPQPYRVGVNGSEWEVIVRSGLWGTVSPAERSILVVLDCFRDLETKITRMSYRAIMRYSGVKKMANVSSAIKKLKKMHALDAIPGRRIGTTRECSSYRVTIDDPKFLELCNDVYRTSREEVEVERAYRQELRREREKKGARKTSSPAKPLFLNGTARQSYTRTRGREEAASSLALRAHPTSENQTSTCEGLNLSAPREAWANNALPVGKREIRFPGRQSIEKQKRILGERG